MGQAGRLFDAKLNRVESKYASTRSTLFGKFYERIISKWLEMEWGYHLERWHNQGTHKPRIYWKNISIDSSSFSAHGELKMRFVNSLKNLVQGNASHCTPDGLFNKDGRCYIWEAKHWPLYPETGGHEKQILDYMIKTPWVLATEFDLSRTAKRIDGFLFSWWEIKPPHKKAELEKTINDIISPNKFEIILTHDILEDCILAQYDWYREIVMQEKENIDRFFAQLIGT